VLGLRFDQDKLVGTRFDSLRALLGDAFIAVTAVDVEARSLGADRTTRRDGQRSSTSRVELQR
jgi:hypothetical protein